MNKMFIAPRHLMFSLFCFFVFLVFETPTYAQPKINKIEGGGARPGQKIDLILTGKDFKSIKWIKKVRISELEVDIIDYKILSNSRLNIQLKIPENAKPGRHKIGFLVSGEGFSAWIESVVKTKSGNPQPEIEIEVDGHKIE